MRNLIIALAIIIISSSSVHADTNSVTAQNMRLAPIAFAVGTWTCRGHYSTVPPFTVEHDVVAIARFAPDVGGQWIVASYQELATPQNPAPISIKDSITIDPFFGQGLRVLFDSNSGRMLGAFTVLGHKLDFTGDYVIAGQSAPFTETVLYDDAADSFISESRVFGVTFQTQTCTKIGA